VNIQKFKTMIRDNRPSQNPLEWQLFLEFVKAYFNNRGIERPIVVELGIWHGVQKQYYEEFLNAEYIGIDFVRKRCVPDILGDTHDEKTVQKLKDRLKGRPINLLFIDAGHTYQDVKRDYNIYAPLTKNIVALHDIILEREEVRFFWDEINPNQEYITQTFIAPPKFHPSENVFIGIGLIIKE